MTGYSSVVRGDRECVGWTRLLSIDSERSLGLLESVNPFPIEFERGVWSGGMLTPGDMDWVEVDIGQEPFGKLFRRLVTVRFRKKPRVELERRLEDAISSRQGAGTVCPEMTEALLWRHRHVTDAYERDKQFWQVSQHLLGSALGRLAELTAELALLANTDPLTGVCNRRKIFELGNIEAELLGRLEIPLSVIMADIDHFKQINDGYGHRVGDEVIKAVAEVLRDGVRMTDHVGRIGGEEFLLLLPNTPASGAHILAENLRKNIEAMRVEGYGKPISLSLSLGHATATSTLAFEKLVARADAALYASKSGGRNRTTGAR